MSNEKTKHSEENQDDVISEAIGEYGRWQLQFTFLLSLFNIPSTWHIFAPTFQAAERNMWCARPSSFDDVDPQMWRNVTQPSGLCSVINVTSTDCDKWEFEGEGNTLITEFELICDRKHLINVAEMMFLAGVAIGGLIGGIISDKYGRKRTLIVTVFLQALLGTIIAFSPWFPMYVVLRTFLGFISVSVVSSGFVLSVELVGGIWRIVAGVSYILPVSLSYMSIAGIAWLVRDWRQLQLAVSLPGFIFVGLWWVLPESPLWLLAMGRTKELTKVLQHAAAVNGRQLPHNIDKQLLPAGDTQGQPAGVLDLFRTPRMRKTTFLLAIIWFSICFVYYGLVLNLGNIGGDLYINSQQNKARHQNGILMEEVKNAIAELNERRDVISNAAENLSKRARLCIKNEVISGAVEIPAIAVSILVLLRMGRRWPLAITMIFSGIACLLALPIPYMLKNSQWLITSLAMIGKFSISSANAVIPVFTAELYPTTIRNIGVGASNVTAGIALLLVPYLWEMAEMHASVPMSVLGVCGVIGGLSVLFLPDAGNAPLQASFKEEEENGVKTISNTRDKKLKKEAT